MTVKRAHMVTRGYLQAWANERDLLYVWDAEARISGPRSVRDATVVRYAYRTEQTTLDLEEHYGKIEGRGLPAIRNIAQGGSLQTAGRIAIVEFLDMHLERGRYADQADVTMPVGIGNFVTGGFEMGEMTLGDRLVLSRDLENEAVRIAKLGVHKWPWRAGTSVDGHLVTGDGAVLTFEDSEGTGICTVTFPLSPSRLLILGKDLPQAPMRRINELTIMKSRRWLVDRLDGALARQMPGR